MRDFTETTEYVACELISWLESAVFDMVDETPSQLDREIKAEDNYNNSGIISDLLGGRIYDHFNGYRTEEDKFSALLVLERLEKNSNRAIREAAKSIYNRIN